MFAPTGATVDEVDELLTTGAGHPMGSLALIDLIGADVTIAARESMAAVENDPRISLAAILRDESELRALLTRPGCA